MRAKPRHADQHKVKTQIFENCSCTRQLPNASAISYSSFMCQVGGRGNLKPRAACNEPGYMHARLLNVIKDSIQAINQPYSQVIINSEPRRDQ